MINGFDSEKYLEDKLKEFKSKKWYRNEDGLEFDGFLTFDDCKRCIEECDFFRGSCDCDCHIHCKTCGTKITYKKIKKISKISCSQCKWKEELQLD